VAATLSSPGSSTGRSGNAGMVQRIHMNRKMKERLSHQGTKSQSGQPTNELPQAMLRSQKEYRSRQRKRCHYHTADEHVDVFGKKVKAKFHRRIFLVVTEVQFVFCFRKIERCAVTFGQSTYKKDQKPSG
jgi:hypothetical protein